MPGVSTHVNFTRLVYNYIGEKINSIMLLLGCIAPDCFDRHNAESFSKYHFSSKEKLFNLEEFLEATASSLNISRDMDSFIYGFYSHLWLDNYLLSNGCCSYFRKLQQIS
jgi:hypothetical protein